MKEMEILLWVSPTILFINFVGLILGTTGLYAAEAEVKRLSWKTVNCSFNVLSFKSCGIFLYDIRHFKRYNMRSCPAWKSLFRGAI